MATLGWNGISETHGNFAGLSMFRPRGKPFPVDAQPKVIVHRAFILHPRGHINMYCTFSFVHYSRDSTFPKQFWVSEWDSLKLYKFLDFFSTFN